MIKKFILSVITLSICFGLCSCGVKNTKNSSSIASSIKDLEDNKENSNLPDWLDASKVDSEVSLYLKTSYNMDNFNTLDRRTVYLENSVIPYDIYYLGACVEDITDEYILVKLNLKSGQTTNEPNVVFSINASSEIEHTTLDSNLLEKYKEDKDLEAVAQGEFTVGAAEKLECEDFEGKDDVLKDIKSLVRDRYFNNNPDETNEPVYNGKTKTKEVYVLNFDEGCWKYNRFAMLVYTEDGTVYTAPLWCSADDRKFYCDEGTNSDRDGYQVSELNSADKGELKEVADYCERLKQNAICKITWEQ